MLATEKSDAIGIAEKISTLHGLHSYRIRAVYLKKKMKLHSMCRSGSSFDTTLSFFFFLSFDFLYILASLGKWRIAVEIASSPEHKIDIFDNLKQQGKYQQAQMAYEHMNLAALGLSPITEEEFLREKALDLYLQFPLDAKVTFRFRFFSCFELSRCCLHHMHHLVGFHYHRKLIGICARCH